MDAVPLLQQIVPLFSHDLQRASTLAPVRANHTDNGDAAVLPFKSDLRFTVAEHMNMGRRMVVGVDHDPQTGVAQDRGHRGLLVQRDVRCVFGLHADDIVAGIDMMDFAGHAGRQVGQEIEARAAHILDRHVAA